MSAPACVDAPRDAADEVEESQSPLMFAPGDPDINWSGPASYSAGWAQQAFKPYPGLYIARLGQNVYAGAVYLSVATLCHFSSFSENSDRLLIQSNQCSGPFVGLNVILDCSKQAGDLACTGSLSTAGGLQSTISASIERGVVCAPDGCYEGPFDPYPPGPDGPADCRKGESPCGGGCCLKGERCGDGDCYIPDDEDAEFIDR